MNYRLKLMITISLLIALSLSLGGTLIISTSFRDFFKQETQAALHSFQSLQNTLLILTSLSPQTDYEILENALSQIGAQHSANWQALSLSSGNTPIFQSGNKQLLTHTLPLPEKEQCSYISISDAFGQAVLIKGILRSGEEQLELLARFDLSAVYTLRQTQQKQYKMESSRQRLCVGGPFCIIRSRASVCRSKTRRDCPQQWRADARASHTVPMRHEG